MVDVELHDYEEGNSHSRSALLEDDDAVKYVARHQENYEYAKCIVRSYPEALELSRWERLEVNGPFVEVFNREKAIGREEEYIPSQHLWYLEFDREDEQVLWMCRGCALAISSTSDREFIDRNPEETNCPGYETH